MRRRVFLLGWPVGHSLSPAMQAAALGALRIDWEYEAVGVRREDLARAVDELLRRPEAVGANITIPHKTGVMEHLDGLSDPARRLGAVNTVVRDEDGRLWGHNTDEPGLSRAVAGWGFPAAGCRAVVLGGGGAARAAVAAMAGLGARQVTVLVRNPAAAGDLSPAVAGTGCGVDVLEWGEIGRALDSDQPDVPVLVINATPVGMWPDTGGSPLERGVVNALSPSTWVLDLIYNPPVTALVAMARKRGLPATGGAAMLVEQGLASLSLWLGESPGPRARSAMASEIQRRLGV